MMPTGEALALGKGVFKIALPCRRVLAFPVAIDLRPIQDGFNPAAKAGSGFALARPDWPENVQH